MHGVFVGVVQAMVHGTGYPPALLGVPGVGVELRDDSGSKSEVGVDTQGVAPAVSSRMQDSRTTERSDPPREVCEDAVGGSEGPNAGPSCIDPASSEEALAQGDDSGVTESRRRSGREHCAPLLSKEGTLGLPMRPGDGDEVVGSRVTVDIAASMEALGVDEAVVRRGVGRSVEGYGEEEVRSSTFEATEERGLQKEQRHDEEMGSVGVAAVDETSTLGVSDEILEVADGSANFEEVSRVINSVYSAR